MTELQKRTLGRTGLEVTQLGFGAMELRGGREEVSVEDSERVLNAVLDGGINFIDTAPDYDLSEERIGKFVSHRRDEFFLATKCGCNIDEAGVTGEPPHLWTGERIRRNIDTSLERMKTDHVDLIQMHGPSVEEVEQSDVVETLQEIKQSGKSRFIGVSSGAPHLVPFARMGVFDTFQVLYSAVERSHEEMLTQAAELGAGIIIRGGIGKGHRAGDGRWENWDKASLEEPAEGMSRYDFVLRFTLGAR